MTLYNSDYIRDFVDHDPSKVLSLRNDEVSVFNRMNMLHKRKISLPTKLSGISENENTFPECMKEKLDELQEYHQVLEKQLVDIFNNISAVVENARRKSHSCLENERPYNILSNEFVTTKNICFSNFKSDNVLWLIFFFTLVMLIVITWQKVPS